MVGAGGAVVKTGIGVTILGKNEEAVNYLMIGKTHTYRIYRRGPALSTGKWPVRGPAAPAWPGRAYPTGKGGGRAMDIPPGSVYSITYQRRVQL
jgi:hypothetical protein